MRRLDGFTLIEILVVAVIIVILAALIIPAVNSSIDKAHYTRWKAHASATRGDDRLLVYYTFEDGAGSTNVENQSVGSGLDNYSRERGVATLGSGHAISTAYGRWPTAGKGGVYFDGTTAGRLIAPRVRYEYDATRPVTVLFWVNVSTADASSYPNGTIFHLGNLSDPNRCSSHFPAGGQIVFDYRQSAIGSGRIQTSLASSLKDRWVHVAFVSAGNDTGNPFEAIYLNGKLINSIAASSAPAMTTGLSGLTVGGSGGCPAPSGAGYAGAYVAQKAKMDEFMIYARVLSASEIKAHYENGKP